jgi:hypothetical protein
MVVASLTYGGIVGIALSGGFLWWEVGRFAAPQVPVTVFDERKLLAAYTVGLFVGVPLAAAYVLLVASLANAALPGAALFLAGLVAGTEVAQLLAVRSAYWGSTPAAPFYAASLRAGVGGILALAAVASYFGTAVSPDVVGIASVLLTALALVALEVAGSLLSLRPRSPSAPQVGGPLAGALFGAVAFFLLGIGPTAGLLGGLAAPVVVLAGATLAYRGRRRVLTDVPAPSGAAPALPSDRPLSYGRTGPLSSQESGEEARK